MADGFDRDHPLFEGSLIVRVVGSGRGKDGERPMTLRVLQTASASNGSRSVRLEIADDNDPFFLRTLDVDETEFAELKHEQRLMVDFADFPAHLVSLLGHVRRPAMTRGQADAAAADADTDADDEADDEVDSSTSSVQDGTASTGKHRGVHASHEAMALLRPTPDDRVFMATLHDSSSVATSASALSARGGVGNGAGYASSSSSSSSSSRSSSGTGLSARRLPSFEVVERTSFRDLVHLDVPVAPGGDAAVKAVLASRLELEQARHVAATLELRATKHALQHTATRLSVLEKASAADRAGADARYRESDARAAAQLAGVREDAARSEAALAARMQEQAAEQRARTEEELGSLRAELRSMADRAQSLDRSLQATKQELEATQRGKAEAERRATGAVQEADRMTARAEAAEARCRKLVATESQLRERCAALGQAAEDRQALAERADETCRAVEQSRAASEHSLSILQESVESLTKKLREAVGRLDQANELNSRLDREVQEAGEARNRAEQARRDAMDREAEAGRVSAAARADAEAAKTQAEAERQARSKAESLAAAAERETLAQREAAAKHARVIEYLNTELSDLRLGTTGRAAMAATRVPVPGGAAMRAAWQPTGSSAHGANTGTRSSYSVPSFGQTIAADASSGGGGGGGTPTAWWRSQPTTRGAVTSQQHPPSAYKVTMTHTPESAPLRSRSGRESSVDSDAKAAAPMPQPAFSGQPHPHTPPSSSSASSSFSATSTSEPGSGGSVRRVAVSRARVITPDTSVSQVTAGSRSVASDPPQIHATSKDSVANTSDVSIGGAARAAGAPTMLSSNPYLKRDWRSASASAPSAYLT